MKARRRIFQFGLAGVFFAIILIALSLAYFRFEMQQYLQREDAVTILTRGGASLHYDFEFDDKTFGRLDLSATPPGSSWLRARFGERFFARLTYASVQGPNFSDDDLEYVGRLTELEMLHLDGASITDSGLRHLSELRRLTGLTLRRTRITDAGLPALSDCRPLSVSLDYTAVSDSGIASLAGVANFEALGLDGTEVTDEGLAHLHRMTKLRMLSVRETRISPEAIREFKHALPLCEVIELSRN